jgi:predicted nucleic acid-binding Zn ribbon protein
MQSLQTLMHHLERSPEWQSMALLRHLLQQWPEIVGSAVAQHSQPTKIVRQVLQVSVSSPAWAQTLTFERSRILANLQSRIPAAHPEIQDLRFEPASWQQRTVRPHQLPRPQLTAHPSWLQSTSRKRPNPPETPTEAFQSWATYKQAQLANQSHCPGCQRPCPTQELHRWQVCAICMTHRWHASTPL